VSNNSDDPISITVFDGYIIEIQSPIEDKLNIKEDDDDDDADFME